VLVILPVWITIWVILWILTASIYLPYYGRLDAEEERNMSRFFLLAPVWPIALVVLVFRYVPVFWAKADWKNRNGS